MTDEQKATIWIGAFRYYCGRMTYAVADFCDALRHEWENIPAQARKMIAAELENEFIRDDEMRTRGASYLPLGNQCDREEWEIVRRIWKVCDGETAVQGDMLLPANAELRGRPLADGPA